MIMRDTLIFAFFQGLYEGLRWGDGAARSAHTVARMNLATLNACKPYTRVR